MRDEPLMQPNDSSFVRFDVPKLTRRISTIVGGYGSGKSEVAVNLARFFVTNQTESVTIADLDIINPYFRSREAAAELAALGIFCLFPPGEQIYAELPIILPNIKSAIQNGTGRLILDVGGDDVGARVLSSLADAFDPSTQDFLFVHNARRPFTADLAGSLKVMREIETASRLHFTGIISNTHLLTDTTPEVLLAGLDLARKIGRETELPVVFMCALKAVLAKVPAGSIDVPVLPLDRALVKPWERKGNTWTDRKLRIH